jgi:hypothetical protein
LIPEIFLTIIGVIVSFNEIPQILISVAALCVGIHTFILPLYYIGVFWVMHFDCGIGCVKCAVGTAFSCIFAGVIFYGIINVVESIKTGIIRFFIFDYESLVIMLLPVTVMMCGLIIVICISLIRRVK